MEWSVKFHVSDFKLIWYKSLRGYAIMNMDLFQKDQLKKVKHECIKCEFFSH